MDGAGIGTYLHNILPRIVAARASWQFTVITTRPSTRTAALARYENVEFAPCRSTIYSLSEQAELPTRAPRRASLFWSPHYNIPILSRAPIAVTVHDVAHLALPEFFPGVAKRFYAKRMFAAVRDRARAVMFDSDFTAREFERLVGRPRLGCTIPLGVDESWFNTSTQPAAAKRPYLLFIGSVKPHKNLPALMAAFERVAGSIPHDLVVIGATRGQRTIDHSALASGARLGHRVKFLDRVDDAVLRGYVQRATGLVFPSLYEGFGLPPLEAMAAGCPPVVSNAGSLPEVCGDAALYCDPLDVDDIARQLMRIVSDESLRCSLIQRGRLRAAEFTWAQAAERTLGVLESILG